MDPSNPFESNLGLINRIVAVTARRHRLGAAEADDFASTVRLRLLADDCAVLRKFEGRSSLATFLAVIIERLLLDFRVSAWGKWRPSAPAKRLGATAVLLERLIHRDGMTTDEAVETALTNLGVEVGRHELRELAARLPGRLRRRMVGDDELESVPSPSDDAEVALLRREGAEAWNRARHHLQRAIDALPTDDRLVLSMRFEDGQQVSAMARALGLEPRLLYRRLESLCRDLRRRVEAAGVTRSDLAYWFDDPESGEDRRDPACAAENPEERPSL